MKRNPGSNLDNFETPKDFIRQVTNAIKGRYASPKDRLDVWVGVMINVVTCARVGEYIESTARENSRRSLYYRVSLLQVDVTRIKKLTLINQNAEFTVFRNEQGKPEFGLKVTKDSRGPRQQGGNAMAIFEGVS